MGGDIVHGVTRYVNGPCGTGSFLQEIYRLFYIKAVAYPAVSFFSDLFVIVCETHDITISK